MTSSITKAQQETVTDIVACVGRLSRARDYLTAVQRMAIAEALRNCADEFDLGATDRLRARLRHGRLVLLTPGNNSGGGKALYRLVE
jgi:hypothetical protein